LNTREITLLSVITALCIGIQLTPRPPNVEFTSLLVFLTGFLFGVRFGIFLGALVMFVNGLLSPWGFAGGILPFQILGMAIIGLAGGVYRRTFKSIDFSLEHLLEVTLLGAFFTLVYDFITNAGHALLFGPDLIAVIITGALFTLIHVLSNTLMFAFAFIPLVEVIKKFLGGDVKWRKG
jgi:hypothetical protein